MSISVKYDDVKYGKLNKWEEALLSEPLQESVLIEMTSNALKEFVLYFVPVYKDIRKQRTLVLSDCIRENFDTEYCKKFTDDYYGKNPTQVFQIDFNNVPKDIEQFDILFSNDYGGIAGSNFCLNILTLNKLIKIQYRYEIGNLIVTPSLIDVGSLAKTSLGWKFYPRFDKTNKDLYDYFYGTY